MNDILKIILSVFIMLCIVSILGFVIFLFVNYNKQWPLKIKVTNTGNVLSNLVVYINETKVNSKSEGKDNGNFSLNKGESKVITINGENPRTKKPYNRNQTTSISVYLENDSSIKFDSINLPKHSIVLSPSISGFAPDNRDPGNTWTKKGYYVVNFPQGIKLF